MTLTQKEAEYILNSFKDDIERYKKFINRELSLKKSYYDFYSGALSATIMSYNFLNGYLDLGGPKYVYKDELEKAINLKTQKGGKK